MITIDYEGLKAERGIDKRVVEVYKYLKVFKECSERDEWLEKRKVCWDLVGENELWTSGEKKAFADEKQLAIVDNKVRKGIQGGCALVTDQKPEIQFHPIGSSDLYVAELLKRAHDVVWYKNGGNDVTYEFCEESKVGGVGVLAAYLNPNKGPFGRIVFEEEDPSDVYWDKDSRKADWSDTHLLIAKLRTKTYILDRYPDVKEKDLWYQEELIDDASNKSEGVTTGDNYAEEGKGEKDDSSLVEKKRVWEIWAWLLKVKNEHWAIYVDEDGEPKPMQFEPTKDSKAEEEAPNAVPEGTTFLQYWPRTREKRIMRHVVGKKLIEQTDSTGKKVKELVNPMGEDSDGDPVLPIIPLLRQKTKHAYRKGDAFFAMDLNKISSKAFANFIHMAAHNVNAPIVEGENVRWVGNPGTPGSRAIVPQNMPQHMLPHRMQPGSIEAAQWMNIKASADDSINDSLDMPDVMRGKVPEGQKNMSGRLGLALQDLAGMMSKPFLRSLESALVRLAKVNIALAIQHWPRYMWERLIEEDEMHNWLPDETKAKLQQQGGGEPDDQMKQEIAMKWMDALNKIRPEDPSEPPGVDLIDLDVRLTAGSSMPTNRLAKMQMAIEMAQAGIYDAEAVLTYIDDPHKDEIVARQKAAQEQAMMAEGMKG